MFKFHLCMLLVVTLISTPVSSAAPQGAKPDFERDLEPILLQYIEAFQITGAAVGRSPACLPTAAGFPSGHFQTELDQAPYIRSGR